MDHLPYTQVDFAIVVQTLALPCTLVLCVTSMLRERFIGYQDDRRLIRVYKQHACAFEIIQFLVTLMTSGFVAGNTVAAIEARSLVIDFASEDVTSNIVRSAIKRNVWLVLSALCVLACMSMLDSWSLPETMQDLTDSLFRLTRELARGCEYGCNIIGFLPADLQADLWRHDHDEHDQIYKTKRLSYDIEQPYPSSVLANESTEDLSSKKNHNASAETADPTQPPRPQNFPTTPPTAPPTPTETQAEPPCFPDLHALITQAQQIPQTPDRTPTPSRTSHPPASRPRYQNQTLTSALRATPKSPKSRARKRSVTFALDRSECAESGHRERSLVRERARELERRLRKGGEKVAAGNEEQEQTASSSVMSSGKDEEECGLVGCEGEQDGAAESGGSAVSVVTED